MGIKILLEEADRKLESTLIDMNISTLEEYTIGSVIGCELVELYKTLIEAVMGEQIMVIGEEISDGKYEIEFMMPNEKKYSNISRGWFGKHNIKELVLEILYCYFEDLKRGNTTNSEEKNSMRKSQITSNEEIFAVIMIEYGKMFRVELYREEPDAIEAFEYWIELSYEDYLAGYPVEDIFKDSKIILLPLIT